MGLIAFFKRLAAKRREKAKPVLGLALGSGGAKGFAELGALKAFEENGITFDIIGGTSIGSIIGAFYADGYSSTDIQNLILGIKLKDVITGLPFNMDMSGIRRVIDREIGGKNIEELKKPFVAVCTDADEMKEVHFTKGKVATAVSGSGCFLPYFRPVVDTEGRRLIDGAYINSIPAREVRELGAEYVVGVDLSAFNPLTPEDKLRPGASKNPKEKGYKYSDVMITPDLSAYTGTSLSGRHEMFELGYAAAMEKMDEIKTGIARFNRKRAKKLKDLDEESFTALTVVKNK